MMAMSVWQEVMVVVVVVVDMVNVPAVQPCRVAQGLLGMFAQMNGAVMCVLFCLC
jgi:hypothetical protein